MNYQQAQEYYLGRQVALKDWYRIVTKPGTGGMVTGILKTNQGELYLSVQLQDMMQTEEQFGIDSFHKTFRVVDH